MAKILIIGSLDTKEVLRRLLGSHELVFWEYSKFSKQLAQLPEEAYDLVLCPVDADYPNVFGKLIEAAQKCVLPPPIIAVMQQVDLDVAAALANMGVQAHLSWPVIVKVWLDTIEQALCERSCRPGPTPPILAEDLIGSCPNIQEAFRVLMRILDLDEPSLFLGERGTGRKTAARRLHEVSPRKNHPFVVVSCAGLTACEQESQLFGHEEGAFSWAVNQLPGSFEQAQGGTLFLDEVEALDLAVQSKLLRTIEEGSIRRLGGNKPFQVDVRLIASATPVIHNKLNAGAFREDLYWLLSRVQVEFPPLRERIGDLEDLANHFLPLLASRKEKQTISRQVIRTLQQYRFPGNIQELRTLVERAAVQCDAAIIDLKFFPAQIRKLAR